MSDNNNWNILKGTDLISESMHKINENFRILKERDDMDDYKWSGYVESITKELENLKKSINEKNSEISNNLTNMDNKINNIPTVTNIKTQVEQAILNAEDTLANVIQSRAGQYVEEKMGDYAKTATVDNISTSFDIYKADAEAKTASVDRIVANSKFYTVFDENVEKSFLVYLDNSTSQYENVGQYYDENKGTIDPDNKGISDPDVMGELEQTFKTVSTELTSIHQEVTEGTSTVNIIAAVKQGLGAGNTGNNAKDISAAIFVQANQSGSEIQLNADNIKLNGDHQLSLTTGTFTVDTNNFKLDGDGDVEITGKITATSGSIGGITIASNEIKSSNNNFSVTSAGVLTAKSGSIGGITIASNEIKSSNDKFSVTGAGKLKASDAEITGEIIASKLKILNNAVFEGSITLHPSYTFDNGYYQDEYTGTIYFGEQGLNLSAANVNLGKYAFIHGFKERITYFDPAAHYLREGTKISNTYDETLEDDFIICGNVYDAPGRPSGANPYTYGGLTIRLYVPEYYDENNNWTRVEPAPIYRVLKILATSSSVTITNSKMACNQDEPTPRIKMSKSHILQRAADTNTYYSYTGVDSVTITAGQMAYVYTLDKSPESDDNEHLGWYVHIVNS